MDPASLIVAALVSGILAGVTRSAQHAVYEGYLDLRSAILRGYGARSGGSLEQAIKALEVDRRSRIGRPHLRGSCNSSVPTRTRSYRSSPTS
jgi:hypothetical protein